MRKPFGNDWSIGLIGVGVTNGALVADRQLPAAFRPAARQNSPAVLGFHPCSKAMCLGPATIIRLKSTFWHFAFRPGTQEPLASTSPASRYTPDPSVYGAREGVSNRTHPRRSRGSTEPRPLGSGPTWRVQHRRGSWAAPCIVAVWPMTAILSACAGRSVCSRSARPDSCPNLDRTRDYSSRLRRRHCSPSDSCIRWSLVRPLQCAD